LGGEFHRIEVDMVFISEKFDKKTKETLWGFIDVDGGVIEIGVASCEV
jgi:hypothetical protein